MKSSITNNKIKNINEMKNKNITQEPIFCLANLWFIQKQVKTAYQRRRVF